MNTQRLDTIGYAAHDNGDTRASMSAERRHDEAAYGMDKVRADLSGVTWAIGNTKAFSPGRLNQYAEQLREIADQMENVAITLGDDMEIKP